MHKTKAFCKVQTIFLIVKTPNQIQTTWSCAFSRRFNARARRYIIWDAVRSCRYQLKTLRTSCEECNWVGYERNTTVWIKSRAMTLRKSLKNNLALQLFLLLLFPHFCTFSLNFFTFSFLVTFLLSWTKNISCQTLSENAWYLELNNSYIRVDDGICMFPRKK